jgi:hypothetical protein
MLSAFEFYRTTELAATCFGVSDRNTFVRSVTMATATTEEVSVAATNAQTTRLLARSVLRDRLLVAVSAASAPVAAANVLGSGFGGLIVVGAGCGRSVRTLKAAYDSRLLVGKDTASYLRYTATPAYPMDLPSIVGGEPITLEACMRDQLADGADFALTPTGKIPDLATLDSVIAMANTITLPGVVVAIPVPARMVTDQYRLGLVSALARSHHPAALIVIGQFDPFAQEGVAKGLRLIAASGADVFLHRSDLAVFEALAYGGLGGSIGYLASLRHTVTGRRPAKTRKIPPDRSPIVFLPEIDSFRHQAVFEPWFRNVRPPICARSGCCRRDLTTLQDNSADHELGNMHNLRAWLPIGGQLVATNAAGRRSWLHAYRQQVEDAYIDLRRTTKIRTIAMDDSQEMWLSLGP